MPAPINAPDSDCNMICIANNTELCGAGNRLAVYEDISVTPLSSGACLDSSQLHGTTFNFGLSTVSESPARLANNELAAHPGQATIQITTVGIFSPFKYRLMN